MSTPLPIARLATTQPDFQPKLLKMLAHEAGQDDAISATVKGILAEVRRRGDEARLSGLGAHEGEEPGHIPGTEAIHLDIGDGTADRAAALHHRLTPGDDDARIPRLPRREDDVASLGPLQHHRVAQRHERRRVEPRKERRLRQHSLDAGEVFVDGGDVGVIHGGGFVVDDGAHVIGAVDDREVVGGGRADRAPQTRHAERRSVDRRGYRRSSKRCAAAAHAES